jgi:hypothetical protein
MYGAEDPYTKNVSQFTMWLYNQVVKSKSQLKILPKNLKITCSPKD